MLIEANFKVLEENPKPQNRLKSFIFSITRPIAKFIDWFNVDKEGRIRERQVRIREVNRKDFIIELTEILYDQVRAQGGYPAYMEPLCHMMCMDKAQEIFRETKQKGGFDELNRLL